MHGPAPEAGRLAPGRRAPAPPAGGAGDPAGAPGGQGAPGRARRLAAAAAFAAVLALLFTAYLRLSLTYPENSDEANLLLMAGDLAHGNLFLSGWHVSDVPFITTELPEMAVLVAVFGLRLSTAHIAAALTYTVVAAMAMLLARGRARGPRAAGRMAVALAVMLAPQPGVGVFVLVFSVGHIGTAAPVMLAWLVLDRFAPPAGGARSRPSRRWAVPAAVGALLAWALMADPLVLVIAVLPVLLVAAARLVTGLSRDDVREAGLPGAVRRVLARRWLEASLIPAAAGAVLLAWCGGRLLRAAGGYVQQPVPFALAPAATWLAHSRVAAHGLLEMFGAFFLPGNAVNRLGPGNYLAAPPLSGLAEAAAASRLLCVAAAAWAAFVTARSFFRRDADLVSQLLLAGAAANLAAYLPSSLAAHTALNAREFAPVLPFAAVIAARVLGDGAGGLAARLLARRGAVRLPGRLLAAALVALLCWYGAGLAAEAGLPAAPDPYAGLESFLLRHHLTSGIGGYWDSSVITVGTGGAVTVRAVTQGCLQPYDWESRPAWYDPARATATFVLDSAGPGYFSKWRASPAALRRLGALARPASPAVLRPGGGYTVRAYRGSIMPLLPLLARC